MSSSPQPVKAKIASIRPVQVEVVPHTPQTSGDLEANNGNGELPQAVEVRSPQRITLRPTISALIGYAIPVAPGRRVQPTNAAPNANFHLSEREKVLMEGYRIARLIRLFTVLEMGFVLLFGILVPPFLCVLPFPLCGYIGARRWNHYLLYIFAVYTALEVIVGIVSLFFFFKQPLYFSLRIIDVLFNLMVLRYANQITAFAKVIEPADRNFLINSQAVKTIEQGLLF